MKTDHIIVICSVCLAGVYLYSTSRIPAVGIGDPLGPKVFPILVGIGLVLAGFLLFLETISKKTRGVENSGKFTERKHLLIIGAAVCWTFIYFIFFEMLGYLISSPIYILGIMYYLNRDKWLLNCIISVLFTLGFYVLLVKLLGADLPKGLLYF